MVWWPPSQVGINVCQSVSPHPPSPTPQIGTPKPLGRYEHGLPPCQFSGSSLRGSEYKPIETGGFLQLHHIKERRLLSEALLRKLSMQKTTPSAWRTSSQSIRFLSVILVLKSRGFGDVLVQRTACLAQRYLPPARHLLVLAMAKRRWSGGLRNALQGNMHKQQLCHREGSKQTNINNA